MFSHRNDSYIRDVKGVANDNDNDADILCGVDSGSACTRHHKGSACSY